MSELLFPVDRWAAMVPAVARRNSAKMKNLQIKKNEKHLKLPT